MKDRAGILLHRFHPSWLILLIGIVLLPALLTACQSPVTSTPETDAVIPELRELYTILGGKAVIGEVISPMVMKDGKKKCQFTNNALMCYDPTAPYTSRMGLMSLGYQLLGKGEDKPQAVASETNVRQANGYEIYEKFIPLYDQLHGQKYVGRPLTGVRINYELRRIEQFFENVGFTQSLDDPNGPVALIPYGDYFCGRDCASRLGERWAIIKSNLVDQPFQESLVRMGITNLFGQPELMPRTLEDGRVEQLYTNALLYMLPDAPGRLFVEKLPEKLGYLQDPPGQKRVDPRLVFYEQKDGLGYNVPVDVDEFITMNGGPDLSGKPISNLKRLPNSNTYQQCFENYCVLYDPSASDALKVRLLPLGQQYMSSYPNANELQVINIFSPDYIALTVSVDKKLAGPRDDQIFRIAVLEKNNEKTPVDSVEAKLTVRTSSGEETNYFMNATDADGISTLVVPPLKKVKNGERITYTVCLNLPSETPICQDDSYLIWNVKK